MMWPGKNTLQCKGQYCDTTGHTLIVPRTPGHAVSPPAGGWARGPTREERAGASRASRGHHWGLHKEGGGRGEGEHPLDEEHHNASQETELAEGGAGPSTSAARLVCATS